MMDMGSYVVHMARMLGGEEPSVISATAKLHEPDVDRAMSAELQFPSGHTASVHCSMWSSSLLHLAARVVGDRGELRVFNPIAPQFVSWLTVRSGGTRRFEIPARRPTYAYQLDAFCDAVLRGQPALTDRAGRGGEHDGHRCRVPCSQHAPTRSVNTAKESAS